MIFLKRKLQSLFLIIIDSLIVKFNVSDSQNINNERSRRALRKTVDYVEKYMCQVKSVSSKWQVLDVAINNVEVENGLFLEFGVFKGDTANYVSNKINDKIHGFDSFDGLPEFWRDGFDKGSFLVEGLPRVNKNVILHKGWFDESIPVFKKKYQTPIAYLHIDCDLYSSTTTIFKELSAQIITGTVIVFDEYFNYPDWEEHEFKAFQEFVSKHRVKYKYLTYNNRSEQVAVKILDIGKQIEF